MKKIPGEAKISSTNIHSLSYRWRWAKGDLSYNDRLDIAGTYASNIGFVEAGEENLYELNVDRDHASHTISNPKIIYGFRPKNGSFTSTKFFSQDDFASASYGSSVTYSLDLASTIQVLELDPTSPAATDRYFKALRNVVNSKKLLSSRFDYDTISSLDSKLICIPSIFYGSSIKKKTLKLKMYFEGDNFAECEDLYGNGVLYQTSGSNADDDSVVGIILYDEGFVWIFGNWDIDAGISDYYTSSLSTTNPKWIYFSNFQTGFNDTNTFYEMTYESENFVPTNFYFLDVDNLEFNNSSNPTFFEENITYEHTKSTFREVKTQVKNVNVNRSLGLKEEFDRVTYIDKIVLYDQDKRPLAVCKFANPIRKKSNNSFTIKLQVDI